MCYGDALLCVFLFDIIRLRIRAFYNVIEVPLGKIGLSGLPTIMMELLLFGVAPELKLTPSILQIKEPELVVTQPAESPPELTIEQKIATNFYSCDETTHYIRADNAQCLLKPVETVSRENTPQPARSSPNLATAPAGWYPVGQCTQYVWSKRPVGRWNNASEWYWQAQRDGWSTGTTPAVGAIGVQKSGNHVVYIEQVDGDRVYISERNYDYKGSYREKWDSASKYNYIY